MQNFFWVTIILLPLVSNAQIPSQQSVKANIEKYGANFPQEKIYIQFDKPVYAPGETIWFKAYLMTGIDVSTISTNLYLDFADANGNILMHVIEPVVHASASGNFDIPGSFKDKSMHVIAYTKWMLNFDSSLLYNKDIYVIQTKPVPSKNTTLPVKASIQFFPEGGDCIVGISNKIAFKALAFNG
jgi:hypothetical protein